jgi:hypothetical protein
MRVLDIAGKRFGLLKAIDAESVTGKRFWRCECDCGNIALYQTFQLTSGQVKSCGCLKRINLIGQRFGKLVVIDHFEIESGNGRKGAICKCDCGKVFHVNSASKLKSSGPRSCGCAKRKMPRRTKFGESLRKRVITQYRFNAKNRGLSFELTESEIINLFKQRCHYCGIQPSKTITRDGLYGEFTYNGIDRLNNDIGYTVDNCVTCCSKCNYIKGKMSDIELTDWIRRVHKNMNL